MWLPENPMATAIIDKQAVAQAFGRAAPHYDAAAHMQRRIGHELCQRLQPVPVGTQVLDVGAGTGHFSAYWREQGCPTVALDLAVGMLAQAKAQQAADAYVLADAEALPFGPACFDLCFSSLALQWCADFGLALRQMVQATRSGGQVAVATLLDGSLAQLRQAWQTVGDADAHVNRFLDPTAVQAACAAAEAGSWDICTQTLTAHYPDTASVLRDLKHIGAHHVHRRPVGRGLLGKGDWQALVQGYEQQRQAEGLPLSYQVAYVLLRVA